MPAPVVVALAKRAGVSPKRAEHVWNVIKDAVVGAHLQSGATIPSSFAKWTDEMWAYTMGAFKRAIKVAPSTEALIDMVLGGATVRSVVELRIGGREDRNTGTTGSNVGITYKEGQSIRSFFDGHGNLRFATLENVLIDSESDARLIELAAFAESADVEHTVLDVFEDYEGSLDNLYAIYADILHEAAIV